jgi:hypothetical protein
VDDSLAPSVIFACARTPFLEKQRVFDAASAALVGLATPTSSPRPHPPLPTTSQRTMKITIYGCSIGRHSMPSRPLGVTLAHQALLLASPRGLEIFAPHVSDSRAVSSRV